MAEITIEAGAEVESKDGRRYVILRVATFSSVLAQDLLTGLPELLDMVDLRPLSDMKKRSSPDVASIPQADWDCARKRLEIITPFLDGRRYSRRELEERATSFGFDAASLYRWRRIYRESGKVSALIPVLRGHIKGRKKLREDVEAIVRGTIEEFYLTKQQPSPADAIMEVRRRCRNANLPAPAPNTIRARILLISEYERLKRRSQAKVAKDLYRLTPGSFDEATSPLSLVQIDHTPLDISVVDDRHRLAIGRPYITLVFDVYSRMVLGFCISLDPTGALSTGLALCHAIFPKETWLAARNIEHDWPCWGFPAKIHVDNAKEFRGTMLLRACQQYNMDLQFRPVATPHYGGHIERMLGTLGKAIRILPGATFANPAERGEYDSDKHAAMTLSEIEAWVAEYITGVYHRKVHSGIKTSPQQRWEAAALGRGRLPSGMRQRVDDDRIRLDFLPYFDRSIQDYGIQIDKIQYFDEVLRPFADAKIDGKPRQFLFRRDPRDISTVYFWHQDLKQYFAIPYRNISRPVMSIWDYRRAQDEAAKATDGAVNEELVFAAYERLQRREEDAVLKTKAARRLVQRRAHRVPAPPPLQLIVDNAPSQQRSRDVVIAPFEIEEA